MRACSTSSKKKVVLFYSTTNLLCCVWSIIYETLYAICIVYIHTVHIYTTYDAVHMWFIRKKYVLCENTATKLEYIYASYMDKAIIITITGATTLDKVFGFLLLFFSYEINLCKYFLSN